MRDPQELYELALESYEEQVLAIYLLRDDAGTPYLLLSRQNNSLLDLTDLPSADELGAELARFLAERSKPGDSQGD